MITEHTAHGDRGERFPDQRRGPGARLWSPAAFAGPRLVVVSLVVAAFALAGVGAAGGTTAPSPVSECTEIREPGTYVLTEDITDATASACIVIGTSDVTLDGQGHTVDGVDEFETAGIVVRGTADAPLTNVTVANLTVTDWGTGVAADGVRGAALADVTATSNRNDGVRLGGAASSVLVRDVDATGNGAGLRVAADGALLENVTASDNDRSGVTLSGEAGAPTVRGLDANDNGETGLVVAGLPLDARASSLRGVTATGNGRYGLRIDRGRVTARNLVVTDNRFLGVNADGASLTLRDTTVADNGNSGLRARRGGRLENVTVTGHEENGIEVGGEAALVDVTATGNGAAVWASGTVTLEALDVGSATLSGTGQRVEIAGTTTPPADPSGHTNVSRFFDATGISLEEGAGGTPFLDVTVRYDEGDAAGIEEPSLSFWRYDAGEWTEVGGSVDPEANTVTANLTSFSTFAPLGVPETAEPSPSSGVNGTVTSADGSPVASAQVGLLNRTTGEVLATATTGGEGRFGLDATPGTYRLTVVASGFQRANRTVNVSAGNVTTADVTLSRVQTVGKVDVVFVLDDTGSMGAEIDGAKQNIRNFTDDLEARGVDARYALITFKDDVELDQPLTDDPAELKAALDQVYASGGGDAREDNFDALKLATQLEFRDGVSRVIVDITDQRAHTRETQSRGVTNYTMADVVEFLAGFQAYVAVSDDFRDSYYGTRCEDPLGPKCGDKRVLANENLDIGEWTNLEQVDAEGEDEFGDILDTVEEVVTRAAEEGPEPEPAPEPEPETDPNDPPLAVEGPDLVVRSGETVVLDGSNSTDDDGEIVRYRWASSRYTDFDLPENDEPRVAFTAPQVPARQDLSFELTVEDDDGETDTQTLYVRVLPDRRRPNLTVTNRSSNAPVVVGENLTVNATVENVGNATGTQPVTLLLNGSHNGTAEVTLDPDNATNVSFSWNTSDGDAGRYNATVTTLNDTNTTNVTVVNVTGDAFWHSPRRPEAGEPVSFISNVSVPRGVDAGAGWDLDGDGAVDETGRYATHTFESPGEYDVTLRVRGADGTRNLTETVTVVAPTSPGPAGSPVEFWMSPRSPAPGETVTLFAETTDPGVTVAEFRWDLDGDGETDATGRTVSTEFREGLDPVLVAELADGRTVRVGGGGSDEGAADEGDGDSTDGADGESERSSDGDASDLGVPLPVDGFGIGDLLPLLGAGSVVGLPGQGGFA